MSISNKFASRPLLPVTNASPAPVQGRSATHRVGAAAATVVAAGATLADKLQAFNAEGLSARLRQFSDTSVKTAISYVKSAVANLAGVMGALAGPAKAGSSAAPAQVPPRRIDQDPAFGAAFDKWVTDNQFEAPKASTAAVNADAARPRAKLPRMSSATIDSPREHEPAHEPASAPPQKRLDQDPGFAAAFEKWVVDNKFEAPRPAAKAAPASTPTPTPTQRPTRPAELSARAGLMSQGIADVTPGRVSTKRSRPKAAASAAASAASSAEPRAKVYTDAKRFASALDRWERDNHFDHDHPMPSGHVAEPRPEFKSSPRIGTPAPRPSAAERQARAEAERAAHQAALDAGYL